MKYTKYHYKKKNEGAKFLTSLVMTTLAAVIIGLIGAWVLLKIIPDINKGNGITQEPVVNVNNNSNTENNGQQVQEQKFAFIQCGYFSKEDNAKQVLAKIENEFNSFMIKDETGKFKVLAGIAKEEDSSEITEKLKAKSIENAKIGVSLNKNDEVQGQIGAITEGYLQIINTASEDEVKEINTSDFKKWTKELSEVKDGDGVDILKEYKTHIEALPETINKENIVSELEYIYSILVKWQK
ncbi:MULTISPECIES: SPOR domain-containing protein [Clostridium]|uniref:SPOR domain-containing protein n=1 Tax=Clostridium TaxID=1485 RepID=UPI000BE2F57C|nr:MULTISPECIES: cell division protein [Clostridium]MDU3525125.1 SPOR domain-containing protein [Clostridium sp.]MDU6363774.1 SPOR domain-containing protein [Clostridium sp.]